MWTTDVDDVSGLPLSLRERVPAVAAAPPCLAPAPVFDDPAGSLVPLAPDPPDPVDPPGLIPTPALSAGPARCVGAVAPAKPAIASASTRVAPISTNRARRRCL